TMTPPGEMRRSAASTRLGIAERISTAPRRTTLEKIAILAVLPKGRPRLITPSPRRKSRLYPENAVGVPTTLRTAVEELNIYPAIKRYFVFTDSVCQRPDDRLPVAPFARKEPAKVPLSREKVAHCCRRAPLYGTMIPL